MKRLYKDDQDKKISGVCAGVADYFGIDPNLVRIGYLILTVLTAVVPCALIYLACAVVLPNKSQV